MKIFFKCLCALILLCGVERFTRSQTEGFRLEKIQSDFPSEPKWEIEAPSLNFALFEKPFTFLGSGVQCYAFLSEDQTTVLKVFKHYHLWPSSKILRKLPLPRFFTSWQKKILDQRKKRMDNIFSSALIAYQHLPEKTGTFYLNINPTREKYPEIHVFDKIGIRHQIDLNTTPFLLQKKADLLFPYLENHREQIPEIIDSFFQCLTNRSQLNILNTDPKITRNFGIENGQVVEIDIGSFMWNFSKQNLPFSKKEFLKQMEEFKEWLKQKAPESLAYFNAKLEEEVFL